MSGEVLSIEHGPIRRFLDTGLQASMDDALSTVPDGKTGAVVATATRTGARLVAVARVGEQWSVVGVLDRQWHGELAAKAAVRFTW